MAPGNDISKNSASESILIVDTEVMMCEILQFKLREEGYAVDVEHTMDSALKRPLADYNLLIVDMMGSEFDGLDLTERVKSDPSTCNIPIIIVTHKSSEDDVVAALDAGADDFIAKPFSSRELVARVRSVLRRRRMMVNRRLGNVLRYKSLQVDMGVDVTTIDGESVGLTRIESAILTMFLRHRNQYFDRCEIRLEAWPDDAQVSDRTVDVNISRLRKKLGEYGQNIVNRQGYGYGFIE